MKIKNIISTLAAAVIAVSIMPVPFAYAEGEAHDTSRNVQTEGVGNPFNYGERNTPADASEEEIRAINHAMSVQEVKYALYKEIDEHWDLISVRLGQPEREKVYALFLGVGTRESTLGGNGDGADIETAQGEGFGVSSAHAYGTLQTAVTAFADCNPLFMKEDNVPEMYQYTFNRSNFYDAIISDHMGIRKILHFVEIGINQEGLTGYQVVRGALKGFNTGWCDYTNENDGYYKNYPDEIISLARWYYEEGHLYDNVFTWTNAEAAAPYREGNPWDWWGTGEPSMAEIKATEPTVKDTLPGDANCDKTVDISDAVLIMQYLSNPEKYTISSKGLENADCTDTGDGVTPIDALAVQMIEAKTINASDLPVTAEYLNSLVG